MCRVTLTSGAASVTYAVEMKYIPERSAFRLTAPLCEAIPGIAQPYARLYIMSRLLIVRRHAN